MSAGTAGARRWDDLVEQIAGHSADAHIIVDRDRAHLSP
jgi:hypothetical protein